MKTRLMVIVVLLAAFFGAATNAQERLSVILDGGETHLGEDMSVTVASADAVLRMRLNDGTIPAGTTFAWKVKVTGEGGAEIAPQEAGVSAEVDKPLLRIEDILAGAVYECTLERKVNDDAPVQSTVKITVPPSGATKLLADALAYPNGSMAPEVPAARSDASGATETGEEEESSVVAPPARESAENLSLNDRFNAVRLWADAIQVAASKQGGATVELQFFSDKLENGPFGKERTGVAWLDSRRVLTAEELYRHLLEAADKAASARSAEAAWTQWQSRRSLFERQMDAGVSVGGLNLPGEIQEMWKAFLDLWEAEIESKELSTQHISDALKEAAVVIVGIVAGIDDKAIAAALAGGQPQGSAGQQSSGTVAGGGYYPRGHSHAAVRHYRIMNRMYRRHAVHRARWGY